ncbi:MAG: hypothetical protein O7E51_13430, partial [Acidobacteria bacterium]|nr:hypothetical protein [Acidobacteriota bacterium]
VLLGAEYDEDLSDLSPDGQWLAYTSDESGQNEIYVRPYPNIEEGKVQVSADGGDEPVWGPDGQELFYRNGNALMVLSFEDDPNFLPGLPEELFTWNAVGAAGGHYDVSPDGRFLVMKAGGGETTGPQIIIIQNWFEELNRLAPPLE